MGISGSRWKKTPLTTNTQPDFSKIGNSELVDRTLRSANWLRTDTIFIENEQTEELSNRHQGSRDRRSRVVSSTPPAGQNWTNYTRIGASPRLATLIAHVNGHRTYSSLISTARGVV